MNRVDSSNVTRIKGRLESELLDTEELLVDDTTYFGLILGFEAVIDIYDEINRSITSRGTIKLA